MSNGNLNNWILPEYNFYEDIVYIYVYRNDYRIFDLLIFDIWFDYFSEKLCFIFYMRKVNKFYK